MCGNAARSFICLPWYFDMLRGKYSVRKFLSFACLLNIHLRTQIIYKLSNKKRSRSPPSSLGFSFDVGFMRCHRTRWYEWRHPRYVLARYFRGRGGENDVICSESWLVTPYESPFAPSIYPHSSSTSMAGISLRNRGKINLQPLTPRLHYHPQFTFDFARVHSSL